MCNDKAFIDETLKLGLEISPIGADAISKLLSRAAATPRPVIERYTALTGPQR